jgi:Putative Flp pilus-assembly TadE/G-like
MRNMLRCRRGSAAFATVVALVPLIGVVALGGEAGSWYVTKQHAQNAADAAAYSGGQWLACSLAAPCTDPASESLAYRGKEFAAQNGFCNAGDTSYPGSRCVTSLPSGTSQSVQVASLTSWNGNNGNFVQATVSQQQPTYLAAVLGLSTVTINTTAVAKVQSAPAPACVLALTGSISFQGSPNINAPNCGLASDDRNPNALNFTGGGMSLNVGSLSAVGGCTGAAQFCNSALINMPAPIPDPFSALDSALTSLCGSNPSLPAACGLPSCSGSSLVAYTAANPCTNNNLHITGNTSPPPLSGVYFISGTLKITGTPTFSGTGVTFILLPGATINNQGNSNIGTTAAPITGPTTAPSASSLPAALQPYASLLQDMVFYEAPTTTATNLTFGGNTNINLSGNIYAPTAAVTFQGNPTITVSGSTGCGQLVAASIAFNGNATFNNNGCSASTKLSIPQYVQLVQ